MLAYGTMVYVAQAAAEETGIDAEIIDLRTLLPLDLDTIVASVKKTGRCVIVHEATLTSGFGAELAALVQEHCFYHLEAPVARVTGWDTPYPHAQEWDYFPGPARVGRALRRNDGGLSMGEHVIKLPDVGEGVAEAELVEWHVKVGDLVREDTVLAAVMTDKATVEIPSPVDGEVLWLGAEIGDMVAVGSPHRADQGGGRGRRRRGAAAEADAQPSRPPRLALAARRRRSRRLPPRSRSASRRSRGTAQPGSPARVRSGHGCGCRRRRTARPAARRGRKAARLARGAPARPGGRHRPAPGAGHRPGRPHHP